MALEEMAWLVPRKDQLLKQLEDTMAAAAAQDSPEHAKQVAAMQRELGPAGVKSCVLCPAFVDTQLSDYVKDMEGVACARVG